MRKTIAAVREQTNEWDGPNGTIEFITVVFTDGDEGSIGAKPENVAKVKEALRKIEGQEGDFDLEEKPEYQGIPQWKIKSYPGKPSWGGGQQSSGGGGQRSWVDTSPSQEAQQCLRSAQTLAGVLIEQGAFGTGEKIDREEIVSWSMAAADSFMRLLVELKTQSNGSPQQTSGGGEQSSEQQYVNSESIDELRQRALDEIGNRNQVVLFYKRSFGEQVAWDDMTAEQLRDALEANAS